MIEGVDLALGNALEPLKAKLTLLATLPEVSQRTAEVILAEIDDDMSRVRMAGHLDFVLGPVSRNNESAERTRSRGLHDGPPWLRATLVPSAWAVLSGTLSILAK